MQLLSVDIQGFKSFAKRVHVAFKPGITGVIGPNGSGKSNIAEALRWVLGEQSSKALRAKGRTDVIYSGESGRTSKAVVTLTFDNESGRFPVASSEVAITRSLTFQGESEYLINNEPIRLVDLQQMLAEAGIGTKGYTVISQGAVDKYLTATPQGRKELFDEATGIKSLQIKLNLSNQKLEKTKRHADEVRAVIAELSPRVTFLKRQVARYDLREKYEHEFRTSQELWYHNAWHNASKELERLQAEQSVFALRIQDARAKRARAEQELLQQVHTEQEKKSSASTRSLLQDCKTCLEKIISGEKIDIAHIKDIHAALEQTLSTAPKALKKIPVHDLETFREEEIRAEREDSAIASAQEQLRSDRTLLEQEILRECGTSALATITTSLPEEKKIPSDQELRALSQKIASIGEKDPLVIKEYEEASLRFNSLQDQLLDIESTMQDIEQWTRQVTLEMQENFQDQFTKIQLSFSKYFTHLFGGGKAELQSTEEGMDIIVIPPKKRPRHVALLSGGERTLTSLALIFAILDVQEPPFIVFDEVDAALDEANSKRFAELLRERSHNTQSIVISHNRETMSVADVLYGVTMHSDGTSHLYSVTIEDIANMPAETPQMQV